MQSTDLSQETLKECTYTMNPKKYRQFILIRRVDRSENIHIQTRLILSIIGKPGILLNANLAILRGIFCAIARFYRSGLVESSFRTDRLGGIIDT